MSDDIVVRDYLRDIFNAAEMEVKRPQDVGPKISPSRMQNCYLASRPLSSEPSYDASGVLSDNIETIMNFNDDGSCLLDMVGYAIIPLEACHEAAADITALREQLAARDAEIVAWLRERAGVAFAKPEPDDWPLDAWNARQLGIHSALHDAATAIEARAYVKGNGDG